MRHTLLPLALVAAMGVFGGAAAGELPAPSGPVILTITGDIANTNVDGAAAFDLAMLDALPSRVTDTVTPWYEGARSFSGPLVSAVLDAVGAKGGTVKVVALNDYAADIPTSDAGAFSVIFATRIDGAPLSVRDKGPVFVIYPFDERPELYNELYFGRSVWQVAKVEVK